MRCSENSSVFRFIAAQTSARCAELAFINRKTDEISIRELHLSLFDCLNIKGEFELFVRELK